MEANCNSQTLNIQNQPTNQKPRSILVDKQFTSEPTTPTTLKLSKKAMIRNHSDLSSRVRKRVTYRLQTSPAKHTLQSTSESLSASQNNPCSNDNELSDGLTSEDNVCTRIAIEDEYIAEDCSEETQFNRNVVTGQAFSRSPSLDYSVQYRDSDDVDRTFPAQQSDIPHNDDDRDNVYGPFCSNTGDTFSNTSHDSDEHWTSKNVAINNGEVCLESPCRNVTQDAKTDYPLGISDHVVLLPLGTMQALASETSDVWLVFVGICVFILPRFNAN